MTDDLTAIDRRLGEIRAEIAFLAAVETALLEGKKKAAIGGDER